MVEQFVWMPASEEFSSTTQPKTSFFAQYAECDCQVWCLRFSHDNS